MKQNKKDNLTNDDRDYIIRKVIDNPKITKKEINEDAGITPPQSRENLVLIPWILDNTICVFGENIEWQHTELRSQRGKKMFPDLIGKDSKGRTVIVEVKFKFDFPSDKKHLRIDIEKKALGQILLYYACANRKEPTDILRLFIVSIDYNKDVDAVCELLRLKGVNIEHISIDKISSKQKGKIHHATRNNQT